MTSVVVIGAGLMGAASAWRLAQRGHEVTLVERTEPAAMDGSSQGSARIFRYAYPDPYYADLVVQARRDYDELEALAGTTLISRTGSLDFGSLRDPRRLAGVLASVGVEHEVWSAEQARERFPGIAVDTEVLWHPDAGVIDARSTVLAMVDALRNLGGRLLAPWPVASVERAGSGYRVSGPQGSVDAEQVVVTAGGWLPSLLSELPLPQGFRELLPRLEVSQEYAYHFPYADGAAWPTVIHKEPAMQTYNLPGGRDAGERGQKVAEFNGGRKMASAVDQDGQIDPANRERMVEYVRRYLPGLVPEPYAETTCLFTNTRTEDFLLDRCDGVTLVSACSGHGAKFAPLIGRMVADVVAGDPAPERFLARTLLAGGNG